LLSLGGEFVSPRPFLLNAFSLVVNYTPCPVKWLRIPK
jgi:hypothetical protein